MDKEDDERVFPGILHSIAVIRVFDFGVRKLKQDTVLHSGIIII